MDKSKQNDSVKKDSVQSKFDKKRDDASRKPEVAQVKRTGQGTIEDSPEEAAP